MLNRYSVRMLFAALALAVAPAAAPAQNQPAPKENAPELSLDSLMTEAPALPQKIKIDEALLTPPENATVDELFDFIEGLQDKLPQPQSQDDLAVLVDAFSATCLKTADIILAKEGLTAEQRERAIQLKVVSLTTRAHSDPDAAKQLDDFVDETLKSAKTDEELVKAYQLKLQTIAAGGDDSLDKISALADEMYALPQEELQVFGIEVKAQCFITKVQKDGELSEDLVKFVDSVIADKKRAPRVREKAYEMKLVASIIASELEREKDVEDQDKAKFQEVEDLFELLTGDDFSTDLKKMVYQLRVQMLLDPNNEDKDVAAKTEKVIEKLRKEEDKELFALGVAVKGQTLLNAAQKNPDEVKALADYAEDVYKLAQEKEELKSQALGLKIQAYRLQEAPKELLEFVNKELAGDADPDLKEKLTQVRLSVISQLVGADVAAFDEYKDLIEEAAKDPQNAQAISQIYVARLSGTLSKIAADKGDLKAFDAAIAQFKSDLLVAPQAITAIMMVKSSVEEIGANNKKPDLFTTTLEQIADFCKTADSEELNAIAQQLDALVKQLKQAAELEKNQKTDDKDAEK